MLTKPIIKEITKRIIKNGILIYTKGKAKKEPNFQILDLLIPRERKIRSIVGGLETSLGKTLWEPLAKELSANNNFEVIDKNLECPTNMPANLQNTLSNILEARTNKNGNLDAKKCHDLIYEACQKFIDEPIVAFKKAPRGFGVDIWLRKDEINYFFDTKTVQPNIGGLSKFVNQLLNWYAYFYSRYPTGKAEARIVFPYNPYNEDFWIKTKSGGFPLEKLNEGWVENEFWDFCTGYENTFGIIRECFTELKNSGEIKNELELLF